MKESGQGMFAIVCAMLDDLANLNHIKLDDYQDPEIQARID